MLTAIFPVWSSRCGRLVVLSELDDRSLQGFNDLLDRHVLLARNLFQRSPVTRRVGIRAPDTEPAAARGKSEPRRGTFIQDE